MTNSTPFAGRRARLAVSILPLMLVAAPVWAAEPPVPQEKPNSPADAEPMRLGEVVVTAPATETPLVVETDPHSARTPIPPADGAGYLKSIPGFSVARQGAIDGDPVLRGAGGSRLNVLLDDTPVLGGCPNRMDPPTAYIFPDSFDKLTVLKGPQSVVHGGSALGTILIEREAPTYTEPSMGGSATALYGSHDRNDEVVDVNGGARPGFVRMIGTHSSSDDYRDGNGDALHSRYWRHSGTAMVGWTPDADTLLKLTADKSQAQAAMPGKMMDGTQFDREAGNVEFTKSNLTPWLARIRAQAYMNYVDHVMDVYSMRASVAGMGSMTAASQVDHLMQGVKGSVDLTPWDDTRISLGADYSYDTHSGRTQTMAEYMRGVSLDSKMRVRDISFETSSAFAEINHDLSATQRLIGGYRVSQVDATRHNVAPNFEDDRTLNSGFGRYEHDLRLGVPVTTYVGLGHVERAPDYWERAKTTSLRTFTLDTEKTDQLDVGALFHHGDWRGSASLFYAHSDNYILVSSSNAKGVEAQRWGGEAELAWQFHPVWRAEVSAAYVHGDNLSEHRALAQTPPLDTQVAVKYDDGTYLGGMVLRAVAGQSRTDTGWGSIIGQDLGATGGFAVLSGHVGMRVTDYFTLTGGVDNILDKTYAEHISKTGTWSGIDLAAYNDTTRVNEPGRTFWIRGSASF